MKEPKNPFEKGYVQSPDEWFKMFRSKAKDIFKDTKEVTLTHYCPHLNKIIQLTTNPDKENECELCLKELSRV